MTVSSEQQPTGGSVIEYMDEVRHEMRRVVWPTREHAWNLTIVVLIIVLLVMAIIFVYDTIFGQLMSIIFNRFNAF